MPSIVDYKSIKSFFHNNFYEGKPKSKSIDQTDLISSLEKRPIEKSLTTKQLHEKTNEVAKIFIKKSSLYAEVNFLYNRCNLGKKTADDARQILHIVKDLSKHKNPGFFKIRSVMNRYFRHISFFRMLFFYYTFAHWIPNLYIKRTVNKILDTSREELAVLKKDDKRLLELGSRIIKTLNSYLANYNNAVNDFRDDATNPLGDRDDYLKEKLKNPKIIGFESIEKLYSEFAKSASQEKMRPDFRPLSKTVRKIQLLEFKIFEKIPKILLMLPQTITYPAGVIPYIVARLLEVIPNAIINNFHRKTIDSFIPSVLEDTLKAVNRSGFSHAINCFLCDVIEDVLIEMDKNPYHKSTKEPPPFVDKALSADIKKFSDLIFTLITREPYQTKEELKRIQKNGLDPKSALERFLKLFNPQYIDREWIKYFFVDKALHPQIIDLFNFLSQPEKFEEYLCNLIELLNKIYDHVPDTTTPEGRALLEEQKEKQQRREDLVDKLIKDAITSATENGMNEFCGVLSKNQDKDLIFAYRKIKEKMLGKLPKISQDARNILSSCRDLIVSFSPINSKTQAKEDIELAKQDLIDLLTIIKNVMPKENGPVKKEMDKHLKEFKITEKTLSDSLNQVDSLHDEIEQLKSISKELKDLKKQLNTKIINIETIKERLDNLQSLKSGLKFDKMIDEYKFISDQFEKIQTHENYISILKEILTNSFFKNGLLLDLAQAQKEYLNSPKSASKEKKLKSLNQKMITSLNNLKPIAEDTDISEMKDAIRKISISDNTQKVRASYNNAKVLFEKKLSKHSSLLKDEKSILTTKCFNKCKSTIIKQENEIPKIFKGTHQNLMKNAQSFSDTINNLKNIVNDIDKKESLGLNGITIGLSGFAAGFATLAASLGYFSHPILGLFSLGTAALFGNEAKNRTIRSAATDYTAIPLAKAAAESAYKVITNSTFYEGLIHSYMKHFIDSVNKK